MTYPAAFFHVNIAIQDNVFQAAQEYGIRHLVFYASSCIYPKTCIQPMKEEYLLTGKPELTSQAYAIAKIAGITACKAYNDQYNANRFIALVPNSLYGPHDNFDLESSHVLAALMRRLHEAKQDCKDSLIFWGSGTPRREFVFCEDAADASIFAMDNANSLDNTHYNIGTQKDHSIKELAGIIASVVGFTGKIMWDTSKPDGSPKKILDSRKFSRLGWKPKISLAKGIEMTYEWYINEKRHKG
jgi:GDP-L-fucose synthase